MISRRQALRSVKLMVLMSDLVVLTYLLDEENNKRMWVRDYLSEEKRRNQGDFDNLMQELRMNEAGNGPLGFFEYMRMTPRQFDELLSMVEPFIAKRNTNFRNCLPSGLRLGITLRYLSTGDIQKSESYAFRVSPPSVSNIIRETCTALWKVLQPRVLPALNKNQWQNIIDDFWTIWNFPNCLGAIDGKHIQIQCPGNSGSKYFNYKGTFSFVLLATCDARYKFTYVDIGSYGGISDGGIFSSSTLGKALAKNTLDVPNKLPLPNTDTELSAFFIGDEAFGLSHRMMRPYSRRDARNFSEEQKVFNYRLSRARRTIENTFGIIANIWRILHSVIIADVENAISYVKAIICLHNHLKAEDDSKPPAQRMYFPPNCVDQEDHNGNVALANWRNAAKSLNSCRRLGSNNASREVFQQRDVLGNYFVTPFASLPWQNDVINRGAN